ncbi:MULTISPECIES: 3'-5' exonuclease [unclassified Undibacterium]|uniref:3'-5' exonuclease n=1 Tax=unclassified Undibacterium TaxID=2630295 RepID=UPI002AC97E28|nr:MULTISPECIES: 3'-5' exonuclease [unclassified Undibacterium]MEB0139276.1 3'-5' exonuclease [Undibacterium sp. CCC2.1]MEB0172120.1 3'-5' exonuclease [Undibacterium sp. CCC1.1]MEB0175995.1 3'-5' exonuclease [Undibacterium sp. CCC3.4]MEB0215307.1 3'-5' exonuclease [Undibacterium sp. 5I2]WPX45481.1 3'-5' exonuclease [Undibacterium sp. CCC3.4]
MNPELDTPLPAYPGIALADICLVQDAATADYAYAQLSAATILGFDTETKPVFNKGQHNDGPHLIQLATEQRAFLFPVSAGSDVAQVKAILEAPQILKVGYGLADDLKYLNSKFAIVTANVLDLSRAMRENKHGDMGAKSAVAKFLGMQMSKSKKTSTSNWAQRPLTERQMLYAANDAQVALLTYRRWLARQAS